MSIQNNTNQIHQVIGNTQAAAVQKNQVHAQKQSVVAVPNHVSTGADVAKLSLTGRTIAAALQTSDVRTEKVAGLQQAIADGSYHVSSADVAGKLVESLQRGIQG